MFDNTLTVLSGGFPSVSIADTDDGRTVRRYNVGGGHFKEIVISRQESNENKVVLTDRYLVQFNWLQPYEADPLKTIRTSASLVIAYPRVGTIDDSDVKNMVLSLFSFLGGAIAAGEVTALNSNLTRIFNGET